MPFCFSPVSCHWVKCHWCWCQWSTCTLPLSRVHSGVLTQNGCQKSPAPILECARSCSHCRCLQLTFVPSNYERVSEHGESLLLCPWGCLSGHQLAPGLLKTLLRHVYECIDGSKVDLMRMRMSVGRLLLDLVDEDITFCLCVVGFILSCSHEWSLWVRVRVYLGYGPSPDCCKNIRSHILCRLLIVYLRPSQMHTQTQCTDTECFTERKYTYTFSFNPYKMALQRTLVTPVHMHAYACWHWPRMDNYTVYVVQMYNTV